MVKTGGFFSPTRLTGNKDKKVASSMSGGSYGGYVDAGDSRGFVSKEQAGKMLSNPEAYKMRPSETRYLRESMNLPRASLSVGDVKVASADTGYDNYLKDSYGFDTNANTYKNMPGYLRQDLRDSYRDDVESGNYKEGSLLNQAKPTEGNILTKTGNFIANVFTPPAVAGTLEGKPTRFAGETDPTPRPKLDYVNPDKKVMTGSEIRDAFRPSNLFGINRNEIGGKLGTYDSPGSPLARDRQETMNRVATKYSSMPAPDPRSLSQIRADRAAKMKTDAQQRQAAFKDTGVQTFGGKVQPQKSADDTYGTNMVSNPAFGFRGKMTEENKAKYDQSSRLANERAKTDPSLGNVITQTFNRLSGAVGGPQASLESIGERQLRLANKEINRPTYQKEAYARQALGITNQMLKDRNMQIIRQNAKARNEAFQAARKQRIAGTDRTVGGARGSSQANTGSGKDGGFGTGTYGKGMPSNPSFRI